MERSGTYRSLQGSSESSSRIEGKVTLLLRALYGPPGLLRDQPHDPDPSRVHVSPFVTFSFPTDTSVPLRGIFLDCNRRPTELGSFLRRT